MSLGYISFGPETLGVDTDNPPNTRSFVPFSRRPNPDPDSRHYRGRTRLSFATPRGHGHVIKPLYDSGRVNLPLGIIMVTLHCHTLRELNERQWINYMVDMRLILPQSTIWYHVKGQEWPHVTFIRWRGWTRGSQKATHGRSAVKRVSLMLLFILIVSHFIAVVGYAGL